MHIAYHINETSGTIQSQSVVYHTLIERSFSSGSLNTLIGHLRISTITQSWKYVHSRRVVQRRNVCPNSTVPSDLINLLKVLVAQLKVLKVGLNPSVPHFNSSAQAVLTAIREGVTLFGMTQKP